MQTLPASHASAAPPKSQMSHVSVKMPTSVAASSKRSIRTGGFSNLGSQIVGNWFYN